MPGQRATQRWPLQPRSRGLPIGEASPRFLLKCFNIEDGRFASFCLCDGFLNIGAQLLLLDFQFAKRPDRMDDELRFAFVFSCLKLVSYEFFQVRRIGELHWN
jgi:hypothetical protein